MELSELPAGYKLLADFAAEVFPDKTPRQRANALRRRIVTRGIEPLKVRIGNRDFDVLTPAHMAAINEPLPAGRPKAS